MSRGRIVGSFDREEVDVDAIGLLMTGAPRRERAAGQPVRRRPSGPPDRSPCAWACRSSPWPSPSALGAIVLLRLRRRPDRRPIGRCSRSSLQGWRSFTRTLTYATPLILTGLAAAVAFKMRVYNIGAEGQLFAGAIAASGLALALPEGMPKASCMVTFVIAGGALAGAAWAQLAAVPKALFGTDEIITTLMLNFIALGLMNYLIQGSLSFWRNPTHPVPQGKDDPGVGPAAGRCTSACTPAFFIAIGAAVVAVAGDALDVVGLPRQDDRRLAAGGTLRRHRRRGDDDRRDGGVRRRSPDSPARSR